MIPVHTPQPEIAVTGGCEVPDTASLRELVHDLRQPLSVIETCAFYLRMVLPAGDDRIEQQLNIIERQVAEADRILRGALGLPHQAVGRAADESFLRTKAESAGLT
jgi:hypothetical protein